MGCVASAAAASPPVTDAAVVLQLAEAPRAHIVVYGASWCPWCKRQLAELDRGGALFTYEAHMCDRVACREQVTTVPTLALADGTRLRGFHTLEQLRARAL